MSHNKDLDKLFQEKFKDFEKQPNPDIWDAIEAKLDKKKKKRPLIWWRFAGVAAILLLFISLGMKFFNNSNTITPNNTKDIVDVEKKESTKEKEKTETKKQIIILKDDKLISIINSRKENNSKINRIKNSNKNNTVNTNQNQLTENKKSINSTKNKDSYALNNTPNVVKNSNNSVSNGDESNKIESNNSDNNLIQKTEKDNSNKIKNKKTNSITSNNISNNKLDEDAKKEDLLEAIKEQESIAKDDDEPKDTKKFSIGSSFEPIYYASTTSNSSPLDSNIASNSKSSALSYSYGVKVNYKINDKWSLQSGIHNVDLAYVTDDVNVSTVPTQRNLFNLAIGVSPEYNVGHSNLNSKIINMSPMNQDIKPVPFFQRSAFSKNGNIKQNIGYIEIPVEIKYNIIHKKIDVKLMGGFSSLFLNKNEVFFKTDSENYTLGKASNINKVNFSANFGIDLNYNVSKKWFINVSPTFKYQLSTFSENDGNFKPYLIGINTGINFKF
jgi:hypothetical protein